MIKRTELLPALVGLVIAALIVSASYMWAAPAPVVFYQRGASALNVKGGDRVTIMWSEVRNAECDSIIFRRLISADRKITEFEVTRSPPKPVGIEVQSTFSFIVPPGLANGPLLYRVAAEFRCNMIQQWFGGQIFVLPDIAFQYTRDGAPS